MRDAHCKTKLADANASDTLSGSVHDSEPVTTTLHNASRDAGNAPSSTLHADDPPPLPIDRSSRSTAVVQGKGSPMGPQNSPDPLDNELIPLSEARKYFPTSSRTGRPVDLCQLYRWTSRGVRGVHLAFRQCPSGRFTTRSAIQKFIDDLTRAAGGDAAPASPRPSPRGHRNRTRASARTDPR